MESIVTRILKEHKQIRALCDRVKKTTERAVVTRKMLLHKIALHVVTHARAEEHVLYKLLRTMPDMRADSLEMIEEHNAAEHLFHELEQTSVTDERWTAKMKVLIEETEHHFEEEEEKVFPEVKKILDQKTQQQLGAQFVKERTKLRKEGISWIK
ncbi:hemerythrin domain-containing protein [Patescibacteria group bacterium]|nr:hemerythrin domain-containing protein [Patescibacteria group bacterium]